jgi:multiple sugar transport system substrate-binding protein
MSFRMKRRHFLQAGTALLAGSMVRPAFAQGEALRLFWWGGQARADRTLAAADLYSETTGAPTLEAEFLSWNDYWTKLATQVAGGAAPDVLQMDYRYIVEYANRNAIAPLDEFVGAGLDLSDFDEDQLEGGRVNGQLYGISLGANSSAVAVNVAAFEEAGIAIPDNSWTYEDIPRLGEAFKEANIRGGLKAINDMSGGDGPFENWLRQRGKALYTAEGELAYEVDDLIEWYTMWHEFREAGYIVGAEDSALDTGAIETSMLALGKSALMGTNSNQLIIHQSVNADPLTIIGFPRIAPDAGGGHYRKPSMFWSVAGSSRNQQAAAEFISFFIKDQEAGKILGVERGIPCSASVREAVSPTLSEQDQIALNFVSNLGDLLGPLPPSPPNAAGEIDIDLMGNVSDEIAFGMRTPEEGARYVYDEARAILARAAS